MLIMNNRLFLYCGALVILLALICLPATAKVTLDMEDETWLAGQIIALEVGLWSLPLFLFGVVENSKSKTAFLEWFAAILFLANSFMALIILDQLRFWRGMEFQMLLNYSPFLAPCVVADVFALFHFAAREKLVCFLKNLYVRVFLLFIFVGVPLFIALGTLVLWLLNI